MGQLDGKVAFITGAARGQGRAEAVKLASEGADIIAFDLAGHIDHVPYDSSSPEDLAETVRQVEALDRKIVAIQGDVRDYAALKDAYAKGVAELGRLDIVVANAGICIPETWDQITPETFQATLDTNAVGAFSTVQLGAPYLIEAGGGAVVLTSSYAGKKMQPFMIHYTASKHAVVGITRGFAAELGKHGIRVNSVHPGAVMTPMGSGDMQGAIARTNETNPKLAGMGTPFLNQFAAAAEEIAEAVFWLASPASSFVTAEHLSVDGGAQYF